ncbi:MAG: sigma-70 family RNA polymerase sigma factor [Sporocytophaga sp.]|uniref:RNA polymerase sigma factor n=1 Tax=Sporocytophaga sp. TaxID=2231183 RepID=UPI001B24D8D2|nr:sigma-70 family RNA polymerase sigma factor [Sporocytophaga sp.]MBO9703295.1 sigma-70 family RNA polymerase sigma factor [Sporocytophaga sp.]
MNNRELIPHLFRTEYRKIVSVLCKHFGADKIEIAEDIASDTFLTAAESWGQSQIPPNPIAWLYSVAKNKAKSYMQRDTLFENKISKEILKSSDTKSELDLSPENITDSQLQMMFAICHPSISTEAQIGLSLRILCGFGIDEIADAFLSNKETINKRLFRAKEKLREEKVKIEVPVASDINERLETVLTTIYLLFNEGYYSESQNSILRKDMCLEAMRLCYMLIENNDTNQPSVNALLSLMCFHASRFEARINEKGEPVLYQEQDVTLWDTELIRKGEYFLTNAAKGPTLSKYHVEAAIAYWHTHKADTKEKWENILQLYNALLQIEYSPIAALNRTYALSKANSKKEAIIEAENLQLTDNHYYYSLLGELYTGIDYSKAKDNYQKALALTKKSTEKQLIEGKMERLRDISNSSID